MQLRVAKRYPGCLAFWLCSKAITLLSNSLGHHSGFQSGKYECLGYSAAGVRDCWSLHSSALHGLLQPHPPSRGSSICPRRMAMGSRMHNHVHLPALQDPSDCLHIDNANACGRNSCGREGYDDQTLGGLPFNDPLVLVEKALCFDTALLRAMLNT
jgi:hypothetical protein